MKVKKKLGFKSFKKIYFEKNFDDKEYLKFFCPEKFHYYCHTKKNCGFSIKEIKELLLKKFNELKNVSITTVRK